MTRSGFAAALLAFALPVRAGVVLQYQDDQKKQTTVELDGKKLRTQWDGAHDRHGASIFDGDAHVFYIVDDGTRSYRRLDEATGAAMGERLKQAMEAAKAKMTPEQRARMESMMTQSQARPSGDAAPRHDWQFERAPGGDKVAGYSCDNYHVLRDGKVESEACFIPWRGGPVQKDDLQAIQELGRFFEKTYSGMAASVGPRAPRGGSDVWLTRFVDTAPGLPAVMRRLDDSDNRTRETRLVKVERTPVSSSRFEPPAGYSEKRGLQ